jgi:hypothetical protein
LYSLIAITAGMESVGNDDDDDGGGGGDGSARGGNDDENNGKFCINVKNVDVPLILVAVDSLQLPTMLLHRDNDDDDDPVTARG